MYYIADFQEKNKKDESDYKGTAMLAGGSALGTLGGTKSFQEVNNLIELDEEQYVDKKNARDKLKEVPVRENYRKAEDFFDKEIRGLKVRNKKRRKRLFKTAGALTGGYLGLTLGSQLGYGANKIRNLIKNNNEK